MTLSVAGATAKFYTPTAQEYQWVRDPGEPSVLTNIAERVDGEETVWDVGANIGIVSCLIARSTDAEVVSFEPHPKNVSKLRANLDLNSLSECVTVAEVALGQAVGIETLYIADDWDTKHSTAVGEGDSILVGATTGDKVALEQGYPDIVKIDVEGAETDVLSGMSAVLQNCHTVYCEIHHVYGVETSAIADKLRSTGFDVKVLRSEEKTSTVIATKYSGG